MHIIDLSHTIHNDIQIYPGDPVPSIRRESPQASGPPRSRSNRCTDPNGPSSPIAIVSRACVVPGALDADALWTAVRDGRDLLSRVDPHRWGRDPKALLCRPDDPSVDRTWSDRGGYVRGFEEIRSAGT